MSITRTIKRFINAKKEPPTSVPPAAPVAAAEPPSDSDALPPNVAIYKIHTYNSERGYVIIFGVPGKGKNFRLRREHWSEPRANQAVWEICTAIGWPDHFDNEEQLLRFVNAAREFARSRRYAIIR